MDLLYSPKADGPHTTSPNPRESLNASHIPKGLAVKISAVIITFR